MKDNRKSLPLKDLTARLQGIPSDTPKAQKGEVYNLLHQVIDKRNASPAMYGIKQAKCRLFEVYFKASTVTPEQLLRCPAEIQQEYARVMDGWRKISVIIDTITSNSPEDVVDAAWARIRAIQASMPR
jgi:hypothetical protein